LDGNRKMIGRIAGNVTLNETSRFTNLEFQLRIPIV
jgi:hypothetical protein